MLMPTPPYQRFVPGHVFDDGTNFGRIEPERLLRPESGINPYLHLALGAPHMHVDGLSRCAFVRVEEQAIAVDDEHNWHGRRS
jgi:hypothetical protein